jgi:hypothetical protein
MACATMHNSVILLRDMFFTGSGQVVKVWMAAGCVLLGLSITWLPCAELKHTQNKTLP